MTLSNTHHTADIARRLATEVPNVDEQFPYWARRSNPIVRRQLGTYWRVFPPQPGPILRLFLIQAFILVLTIFYPVIFVVVLTFLLASATLLPYAFYLYIKTIGLVIAEATTAMSDEFKNDTLALLRTTPIPTREIILSKAAASVWRRMDDLDQVISFAIALGMPAIAIFYLDRWSPDVVPALSQGLTITAFAASIIRLPLELFMVATFGIMMGAAVPVRSTAFLSTIVFTFFYFLLLNMLRFLPHGWAMQMFVDTVLPIVLPIAISWAAINFTHHLIIRD